MRIAILEDDPDQRALITATFQAQGVIVDGFEVPRALFRALPTATYDLLILDWKLPELDGLEVLSTLRQEHRWNGAVLFITADSHEDNVLKALSTGADDFLNKPLRIPELKARVEALTRRLGHVDRTTASTQIGPFRLGRAPDRVYLNDMPMALSEREYRLAALFFENPGQVLSRDYLLKNIWGVQGDLSTRTVDTHISRLRRKLGLAGEHGLSLKSVYQQGYRLEDDSRTE